MLFYIMDHPLSTCAKFSEKLIRKCAYQGVRNVSFSKNFGYVLNGWPLTCRGAFNPEKREMTLICEKINLRVAPYYHCIDDLSWREEQNLRTIIFPNNSGCLFLPFMSNGWSYKSSRRREKPCNETYYLSYY